MPTRANLKFRFQKKINGPEKKGGLSLKMLWVGLQDGGNKDQIDSARVFGVSVLSAAKSIQITTPRHRYAMRPQLRLPQHRTAHVRFARELSRRIRASDRVLTP